MCVPTFPLMHVALCMYRYSPVIASHATHTLRKHAVTMAVHVKNRERETNKQTNKKTTELPLGIKNKFVYKRYLRYIPLVANLSYWFSSN